MENLRYYIRKEMITTIPNQVVQETYNKVEFEEKDVKIKDLVMKVTSHRILFTSETKHAFLVDLSSVMSADNKEEGFFSKSKFIELKTIFNDRLKLSLKNQDDALVQIRGVLNKGLWKQVITTVKAEKQPTLFAGIYDHQKKINQEITDKGNKVSSSFENFENLFQNAKQLKQITNFVKDNLKLYDESFQNKTDLDKILNDIGFVSIVTKEEAGKEYYKQQARNIYKVCSQTLFKQYGGMVSLLDLFYFYNKKRQTSLIAPEELLKACNEFQGLGLEARLVVYPNNIKMIESSSYDVVADFQINYSSYFSYDVGITAQQIARKKGIPPIIVQIKMSNALKRGRIVKDDRIEGLKYFNNLILQLQQV